MSKALPTGVHDKLISFFSPTEIPTLKRQFKKVFQAATFETELPCDDEGKNSLFSLFNLIEILDGD